MPVHSHVLLLVFKEFGRFRHETAQALSQGMSALSTCWFSNGVRAGEVFHKGRKGVGGMPSPRHGLSGRPGNKRVGSRFLGQAIRRLPVCPCKG